MGGCLSGGGRWVAVCVFVCVCVCLCVCVSFVCSPVLYARLLISLCAWAFVVLFPPPSFLSCWGVLLCQQHNMCIVLFTKP